MFPDMVLLPTVLLCVIMLTGAHDQCSPVGEEFPENVCAAPGHITECSETKTAGTKLYALPYVDSTTHGAWNDKYGHGAFVLAGYHGAFGCELPILPTQQIDGRVLPCHTYHGGASSALSDCSMLDLNKDGKSDVTYHPYAGATSPNGRVLVHPDGKCSQDSSSLKGPQEMSYTIKGLSSGSYMLSLYVLGNMEQDIQVCVDDSCGPAIVSANAQQGVYHHFNLKVADQEEVTLKHHGSNGTVVQGVFLDSVATTPTVCTGVCYLPELEDRRTGGVWRQFYGSKGFILFNRQSPVNGGSDTSRHMIGGFKEGKFVTVEHRHTLTNALHNNALSCGSAMSYVWNCEDRSGRALDPPTSTVGTCRPNCGFRPAAGWDDAGERQDTPPDLYIDIATQYVGRVNLTVYAVDYDYGGRCVNSQGQRQVRLQQYDLFHYRSNRQITDTTVDIGSFTEGKYVTYPLLGPFKVTLRAHAYHDCSGEPAALNHRANAFVSGLFINPYHSS